MKNKTEFDLKTAGQKTINLAHETISNKPFGICGYSLHPVYVKSKHWFFGTRYKTTNQLEWRHLCNSWYKTKKSQLQALEDLCKKYPQYRFVPFKNNYKSMPQTKQNINVTYYL